MCCSPCGRYPQVWTKTGGEDGGTKPRSDRDDKRTDGGERKGDEKKKGREERVSGERRKARGRYLTCMGVGTQARVTNYSQRNGRL